jgi:hypothetical protein
MGHADRRPRDAGGVSVRSGVELHPCRCRPQHRGQPIDAATLNGGWRGLVDGSAPSFLIVPGYTPMFGWKAGLHPRAVKRLARAAEALSTRRAATVIVSGGAVHSPDNEAILMRQWLLDQGIDAARILVDPCARHTTTNLRNAGRIVLAAGASEALVVTSGDQLYYLAHPWRSSFHLRCLGQLGYRLGELALGEGGYVRFRPSAAVFRASRRESRAGDP